MIKVLVIEKSISERILIQTYLPGSCIHVSISEVSEVSACLENMQAEVVIAGPSVAKNDYFIISEIIRGSPGAALFVIFTRISENENAAKRAFGMVNSVRTVFAVMPAPQDLLSDSFSELAKKKLESVCNTADNFLDRKMADLVGESCDIAKLKSDILRYSTAPGPVLISGESGTGKEIVAKLLHDFSHRKEKIYYALNAGVIPPGVSETELFGSEPGAFTGAISRKGCFEHADGGTLFLDEIAELERSIQVEFLRVLETGFVRRMGSGKQIKTNVRLITATNRNLNSEVKKGLFRKDLLYRINVFQIKIPPLREHKEDIPDLLRHFSGQLETVRPNKYYRFSDSFIEGLLEHDWPGNIRELRNVFQRAVYASDSDVLTADSLHFDKLD